jgi:hypothetical protein
MIKKSFILLGAMALLLVGAAVVWRTRDTPTDSVAVRPAPAPPEIRTVAVAANRTLSAKDATGMARRAPTLPSLADALGHDTKLAFPLRLEVVHRLDDATAARETAILAAFVADSRRPAGLIDIQQRALKNDVLNVLVRVESFRSELVALLRRIQADETQDPAMRDYALQHLSGLETGSSATTQHWRVAEGADPALAATAMLHLLSLDRTGGLSTADRSRLAGTALKLAADEKQPETSRATALQVCARLKLTDARSLAWDVARSDKASMPFRIAAVATLGDVGGDPAIRDYLQQLTTGPDGRLRLPARSALQRLSIN